MNVLIGCEFSGVVRRAFRSLGHNAWSCDLLPAEDGSEFHIQGDIRIPYIMDFCSWDLGIFHPPCTYLTNAGVRHLHENVVSRRGNRAKVYGAARMDAMRESAHFFKWLCDLPIPRIVVENPIPHKYAREIIGPYSQLIQPWMFGHPERKATCLWLKDLPLLKPTNIVKEQMLALPKPEQNRVHYMPPGPERWKNRSRTYKGIADAFADQYGRY